MYLNSNFRFLLSFSFIFLWYLSVNAQTLYRTTSEKLKKADENFQILNYSEAINLYKEVLRKEPNDSIIICKIANSYRLLNKTDEAELWYRKVFTDSSANVGHDYIFQFAQTLACNLKYPEALSWYKYYHKLEPSDNRAVEAVKSLENISGLYRDSVFYVVQRLAVNSGLTELAPRLYKNGIIFLSDRDDKENRLLRRYFLKTGPQGPDAVPSKFNAGVNVEFNEGTMSFYKNYSRVIFSQNYLHNKNELKKGASVPFRLFSADTDSTGWHNIEILPFQTEELSYTQPSVNESGNILLFASDMPGGYGGYDIYAVSNQNGSWGTPYNLGSSVNTPGDEMFPFIFKDSVLFFSSNGRGGLGEHDVFRFVTGDSLSLKNMGTPVNSSLDDFGFVMDSTGRAGYFSSNRNNDLTGDDIYSFKQVKKSVKIRIVDELSGSPLQFSNILFKDSMLAEQYGTTDANGIVEVIVPMDSAVEMVVKKDEALPVKIVLNHQGEQFIPEVKLKGEVKPETDPIYSDLKGGPLVYKIQIMASRQPATKVEIKRKYKGNLKATELYEDNWYKYVIGEYSSYAEAKTAEAKSNVYDSFIVVYDGEKRVQVFFRYTSGN